MDDKEFDAALIAAAFDQAALTGWRSLSIVEAARDADLPLDRARARFPGPGVVLARFGSIADQEALAELPTEPVVRDRLFDLIMRRFDVLQRHRSGMLALLRLLPTAPGLSLLLAGATARSMGWMLEAAGVSAQGVVGRTRVAGLVGVWLYTLRAWREDESIDLAGTMAALDKALDQAEKVSGYLGGGGTQADATVEAKVEADLASEQPSEAASASEGFVSEPLRLSEASDPSFPPPPSVPEPPASPI